MRAKGTIVLVLVLFLAGVFCLWGQQKKNPDEKKETEAPKSLIRKDLLIKEEDAPQHPRRNIFSPRGTAVREEDVATLVSPREMREQEATTDEETPFFDVSLRYIGYIDTGQRIVALIIFEGEAVAVEEGEMISEHYKLGKVTRDTLSIIGPGGEIKDFPLEGE